MIHELKIKPEYFAAVVSGDKNFEIRNNADRNFQVGDTLLLWEWDEGFTSQTAERTVSYITDFEQKPGYVVLGLANKREQELAEQLEDATRQCGVMADLLRGANDSVYFHLESPDSRLSGEEAGKLIALTESIADALAGKLPEQHSDDTAVDRFAVAMKTKLASARAKGRSGWDDPAACSVEYLADLLVDHVGKGNSGTFEDVANFAMMLHQRGAHPAILASASTLATCATCSGYGMVGGVTGQTPESMDFWEAGCPDCDGRGKVKVNTRTITETIRTAPERIWLQVGDQSGDSDYPFPEHHDEVTWCADSVVACEVPYVRADLAGHVVSPSLGLLIQMTDILKMCRSALITAHEDVQDDTGKGVIQYRIKLATKAINMAEHAIDASQVKSGRFITEGQELELITVLQSIVNGFSDDPAHDAAALLKRITGEVPWTGDSFQLPPHQGGEPCAIEPRSSSPA